MPKIHKTKRFIRIRILDPKLFRKSSLRTHDIGRKGFSKRIAGKLKKTGEWQTQAILISRDESPSMKKKLRKQAMDLRRRLK